MAIASVLILAESLPFCKILKELELAVYFTPKVNNGKVSNFAIVNFVKVTDFDKVKF